MQSPRAFNFSAGPATLPLSVLQEAKQDLLSLPGLGISVLEISHRSSTFDKILNKAQDNLRDLLSIPDNYRILFLQGGATLQFSMIPMTFLRNSGKTADYIVTGAWGKKALKEAKREGSTRVAWTGESDNFTRAPLTEDVILGTNPAYAHCTSNETIQGVQFKYQIDTGDIPLFCDMSSDFLSRPIDIEKYSLVYAGAQKNAGPAGVTIVIIRENMLDKVPSDMHTLLDYKVHVNKNSLYNTPPVFAIYIVMLVTNWLRNEIGGLEKMSAINQRKSKLLYDVIDRSDGFYRGHAAPDNRSCMNVTWHLGDKELKTTFAREAQERELLNLNGHVSVGGLRASIYNAMPVDGVKALSDFMVDFQSRYS